MIDELEMLDRERIRNERQEFIMKETFKYPDYPEHIVRKACGNVSWGIKMSLLNKITSITGPFGSRKNDAYLPSLMMVFFSKKSRETGNNQHLLRIPKNFEESERLKKDPQLISIMKAYSIRKIYNDNVRRVINKKVREFYIELAELIHQEILKICSTNH